MKDNKVTNQAWQRFFKSQLGKELIAGIESIRDEKIGKAMAVADTAMPNEAIMANVSQAKGIEEVLTYLKAKYMSSQSKQGEEMESGI